MKTFLSLVFTGLVSTAVAQVDTARNVVHSTVRGTAQAARTVAHGVARAADTVEDVFVPDSDARRVDVTVTDNGVDMPTHLRPGKTAFVVKNTGNGPENFEVVGPGVDRKFMTPPKPGQAKVMHINLKRGTYTVYSTPADERKRVARATLRVR